jgi:hypothetical protein
MPAEDAPTVAEQEIVEIARCLRATGDVGPLVELLRGSDGGPEHARDALRTLGELDLDVLVQLLLDTLIAEHIDDPALAVQTRRIVHAGAGDPP